MVNQIFNIAGNYEDTNLNVVTKILNILDKNLNIINHIEFMTRPGQDCRYSINDSKLKKLGWQPQASFNKELPSIIKYYKNNFIW